MQQHYVLKSRSQDIKFQGHYKDMTACVEDALEQGVDLTNSKLSGHNLSYANLDGADFSGSDFSGCNLTGTNMSEAVLNKCLFSNASLIDVCMCESQIDESIFYETSFSAMDVAGALFSKSLFSCPSVFSMKWTEAAFMKECVYFHEGQYCNINGAPYVLQGLPSLVVIMDQHIMIGQCIKTLREWHNMCSFCCHGSHDNDSSKIDICAADKALSIFRMHQDLIKKLYEQRNGKATIREDVSYNISKNCGFLSENMH